VSAEHDRGAVLSGNGNDPASSGGGPLEPVTHRRIGQVPWRPSFPSGAKQLSGGVGGAVHVPPLVQAEPVIADYPVHIGITPGQDHGMTGAGPGDGVLVMGLREDRPTGEEQVQATGTEVAAEALEIVRAELVDRDDQDEPWRSRRLRMADLDCETQR
jgi:hypothetical protein